MKKCYLILTSIFIAYLSFLLSPVVTQAQSSNQDFSLSVHPPVAYVYVQPGEKLQHTILVKNTGQKPLTISVNVTDFESDGKTGQPVIQPGRFFNKTANPDLSFGEPFRLEPNRTHSVNLQFDVSDLPIEKEYPLTVLINAFYAEPSSNQSINNSSQAKIAGSVASNLIVYIGHNQDNQGIISLKQIKIPKLIDCFSGIAFELLAKNSGSTADLIQGRAIIKNIFQHTINEYIFYPDFVLANSTRLVRGTEFSPTLLNNEGLLDPEKVDQLTTQFRYKPPFMLGLYTVEINLAGNQTTETVIALPFSIFIALGVGFFVYWFYKLLAGF